MNLYSNKIANFIITGGENVSPKEIEAATNRLGEVVESSVVGIFDEKWGKKSSLLKNFPEIAWAKS